MPSASTSQLSRSIATMRGDDARPPVGGTTSPPKRAGSNGSLHLSGLSGLGPTSGSTSTAPNSPLTPGGTNSKGTKRSREGILKSSRSDSASSFATISFQPDERESTPTPSAADMALTAAQAPIAVPRKSSLKKTATLSSGGTLGNLDSSSDGLSSSMSSSFPSKRRSFNDGPSSSTSTTSQQQPLGGPGRPVGALSSTGNSSSVAGETFKQGMYMSFVTNALSQKAAGNPTHYYELVSAFQTPSVAPGAGAPPAGALGLAPPSTLQSWLTALSAHVSKLDSSHSELVQNIILLPWTTMNESFATAWVRFVCALVSARGEWIVTLLERAVKGLSYRSDWRALAFAGFSSDPLEQQSASESAPTRRQIYARIHRLIRQLIVLIPTLPSYLAPLLKRNFPPKRDSRTAQLVFIRNALKLCEYCHELSESVLGLVIGRALQIDVEIQVELDELEEEQQQQGTDMFKDENLDPFDRKIDDDAESDDGEGSDDGDEEDGLSVLSDDEDDLLAGKGDSARSMDHIRQQVQHLDSIMKSAFEHLEGLQSHYRSQADHYSTTSRPPVLADDMLSEAPLRGAGQRGAEKALYRDMRSGAEALQARQSLFAALLSIFSRSILPTFKSRHVQFLLFWYSSLDAEYADFFLGALVSKAIYGSADMNVDGGQGASSGGDEPAIIRVAAASYVASLVSRAKFIDGDICRDVVENLCAFLEAHLEAYNTPGAPIALASPGTDPHSIFYSVAQATFYIFCFRWRDLTSHAAAKAQNGAGANGHAAQSLTSSNGGFGVSPAFSSDSKGISGASDSDISAPGTGAHSDNLLTGEGWTSGLPILIRAVTSSLNPLRYCSPAIVNQFASVAQHAGFFYCFSIIEANKRIAKNEDVMQALKEGSEIPDTPTKEAPPRQMDSPAQSRRDTQERLVDSFFPFDPYRLRTSAGYIDNLYREWSEVAPDEDSDDDDEEESSEADGMDESDDDDESLPRIGASGALAVPNTGKRAKKQKHKNLAYSSTSSAATGTTGVSSVTSSEAQSSVAQSFEAMSISPYKR